MSEIYFYSNKDEWGELSNFYPSPFVWNGKLYRTVEHYFQSLKFVDPDHAETIRLAISPMVAKRLGQSRNHQIHYNWDKQRDFVMVRGLCYKFSDPMFESVLLRTGNATLIENSPTDSYWGNGPDGKGRNRLGELLMNLRKVCVDKRTKTAERIFERYITGTNLKDILEDEIGQDQSDS